MPASKKLISTLSMLAAAALVGATGATAHAATPTTTPAADTFRKQAATQCTPFTKAKDAKNAAATGTDVVSLWTSIWDMPGAKQLYDAYLTPGKTSLIRTQVGGRTVLADFRKAHETGKAVDRLVADLKSRLRSTSVSFGTDYDLTRAGLGRNVPISWSDLDTTPGFIAGGLSGVQLPDNGPFIPDSRQITGKYSLAKTMVNGTSKVTLTVHDLHLKVLDSIDFCPGNLGSGMIRRVALGLSRLERTPYVDAKKCVAAMRCTYAKPVLFEVDVPLNDVSVDVTKLL
jgi:hypothetical protein